MAVADAMKADLRLEIIRQARRESALFQVLFRIEQRKSTPLTGKSHGRAIRHVAHGPAYARGKITTLLRVVANAQHDQGIAQARETHAYAPLCSRLISLFGKRPKRDVEHVV